MEGGLQEGRREFGFAGKRRGKVGWEKQIQFTGSLPPSPPLSPFFCQKKIVRCAPGTTFAKEDIHAGRSRQKSSYILNLP